MWKTISTLRIETNVPRLFYICASRTHLPLTLLRASASIDFPRETKTLREGKRIPSFRRTGGVSQERLLRRATLAEQQGTNPLPLSVVSSLLDTVDRPLLVSERGGRFLFVNQRAQQYLSSRGVAAASHANLFADLLHIDPKVIFGQMESGEHEVDLLVDCPSGQARARLQWLPEPD